MLPDGHVIRTIYVFTSANRQMAAEVLPLFDRIGRYLRVLRASTLGQSTISALALPVVLIYGMQYRWILALIIAAYTGLKIRRFLKTDRALKLIRLDERFFREQMDEETLRRCAGQTNHLWHQSISLHAIRSIINRPLPRILSRKEKIARVNRRFQRYLKPVIPRTYAPEAVIPVVLLVWVFVSHGSSGPDLRISLSIAILLIISGLEVLIISRSRGMKSLLDRITPQLSEWALDAVGRYEEAAQEGAPYRHDLLYHADPVYSAGVARQNDAESETPQENE